MSWLESPRAQFGSTTCDLIATDPRTALVWAEISERYFTDVIERFPDRVINVGIREQLLVNVGAGLALTGLRPIVHTFATFLVERAFEQIKLGFAHQGVGGVLVGVGGSFDSAGSGRTHQAPGDVALLDTLPGISIHAPSTSAEVDAVLRAAVAAEGLHYVRLVEQQNSATLPVEPGLQIVRRGRGPTVIALGPVLDAALAGTAHLDATVLYATSVRPFDAAGLRAGLGLADAAYPEVVLIEPWLASTSGHVVSRALADTPHRLLSLGVEQVELRRYGTPEDHVRAHGLDARGIRESVDAWL